jgi:hypothetical protein
MTSSGVRDLHVKTNSPPQERSRIPATPRATISTFPLGLPLCASVIHSEQHVNTVVSCLKICALLVAVAADLGGV